MQRHQRVPVEQTPDARRVPVGGCGQPGFSVNFLKLELQYAGAGGFHVEAQGQAALGFNRDHRPEIKLVAQVQFSRVRAAATKTGPGNQPVERAA